MEKQKRSTPEKLKQLEKRAAKELNILNYPPRKNWIPERKTHNGSHIYDVVIVGGGQTGMALAFSLLREKITNTLQSVLSEVWGSNQGLSSPKQLIVILKIQRLRFSPHLYKLGIIRVIELPAKHFV